MSMHGSEGWLLRHLGARDVRWGKDGGGRGVGGGAEGQAGGGGDTKTESGALLQRGMEGEGGRGGPAPGCAPWTPPSPPPRSASVLVATWSATARPTGPPPAPAAPPRYRPLGRPAPTLGPPRYRPTRRSTRPGPAGGVHPWAAADRAPCGNRAARPPRRHSVRPPRRGRAGLPLRYPRRSRRRRTRLRRRWVAVGRRGARRRRGCPGEAPHGHGRHW